MPSSPSLPPGPRESSLTQLLRYVPRPAEFLEECRGQFGDVFTLRFAGFGTFVLLARPAAVQDVFRGSPTALHSGEANAFLAVTVGPRSVLVLDEKEHARQRRVLIPPFHGERMRAHVDRMRRATEESIAAWPRGEPFALEERMREITLRSILEVVLGIDGDGEADRRLSRDFTRMLATGRVPYALVMAKLAPHRLLRHVPFLPYYRELRRIDAALRDHVRRRRAEGGARGDVLADLLRARHDDGAAIDDGEIRDALMTMLVAGHDTTAVALAWILLELLERQDVLDSVRAELRRVVGDGPVRADHLPRLELLDAVIRESLRLRTVLPFVTRLLNEPFRAGGDDYPAGVHLCPCIHLVHRDPELYPEPELFRPARFLERKFGPHEWLPFGGGDRLCIGMAFAMTQMKVVIATVAGAVDLRRPAGAATHRVRRGVLIAPSDGTQAIVAA
jgi:cytochrome P450